MRQSATGENLGRLKGDTPSLERDPSGTPGDERSPMEKRPLIMLVLQDDPKEKRRILASMRRTSAEIRCVSTVTAALQLLERDRFDAIMIDRHLGGWVSAQTCRDLVVRAGATPVVGLINEDCVLGLEDGIEAGLTGVYYKDQMDVHLMRRLGRLAYPPGGYRSPLNASVRRARPARMSRPRPRS
jgi:DNA-binding NarL/FixJ family response regulator